MALGAVCDASGFKPVRSISSASPTPSLSLRGLPRGAPGEPDDRGTEGEEVIVDRHQPVHLARQREHHDLGGSTPAR